jgi:hypothetical protein
LRVFNKFLESSEGLPKDFSSTIRSCGDRKMVNTAVENALRGGRDADFGHRLLLPDDRTEHLQVLANPMRTLRSITWLAWPKEK